MNIASPETLKMLRDGAERIVTAATPPEALEEAGVYKHSSHPEREFVFAVTGTSKYMLDHKVYELRPGTLLLIDAWVSHAQGYTREDRDLIHLWGHFFSDGLQVDILTVSTAGRIVFEDIRNMLMPDSIGKAAAERWDRLAALETADDPTVMALMRSPMDLILDEVAYQISNSADVLPSSSRIAAMQSYIRAHNGRDCSLEHLQKISGLSRFHLCRRFREETGCTIGDFINLVREDYSRAALKHGHKQKEIAFELGFSSPTAFWNWYRKHRQAIHETGE